MSTRFFTNNGENTLLNKFKGVFENNKDIEFFDALVGYFRASGYFRIRPFLDKVPHIRILVGINVDKMLADAQKSGLEFFKHDEKGKKAAEGDVIMMDMVYKNEKDNLVSNSRNLIRSGAAYLKGILAKIWFNSTNHPRTHRILRVRYLGA
jgi:hypothetical protein